MWETLITSGPVYQENALTTIPDINGDGIDDVIIGTTGGDRSVRALSGKTGAPLWRYDTHAYGGGGWVYQVDAKYDYNNDGHPDVLACAGDDGNGTGPRNVMCVNGLSGALLWVCPTGGPVFSVTGVDDFNGDGKPDVVAGASNAAETQSKVYGIDGTNGAILWTNIPAGTSVWALLQIDDVTGDGIRDLATGDYAGHANFHNAVTGNREKSTLVQANSIILRFEDMGDVNKDGHPDFIVGHSGANAVVMNGYTDEILWQKPLSDKSWNVTNMGDITWDGTNDAGIGTLYQDNRTYFMDGATGQTLASLVSNTPIDALDAIPDIVGDNSMEMVAGGRNGLVVCLSGGYDSTLTGVPGRDDVHPVNVAVYPNPCDDLLHVYTDLKATSDVSITVTGATGLVLYQSTIEQASPGSHVFDLRRNSFAGGTVPGVCIVTVGTIDGIRHFKVVFR